jgi:hypothetical protein
MAAFSDFALGLGDALVLGRAGGLLGLLLRRQPQLLFQPLLLEQTPSLSASRSCRAIASALRVVGERTGKSNLPPPRLVHSISTSSS